MDSVCGPAHTASNSNPQQKHRWIGRALRALPLLGAAYYFASRNNAFTPIREGLPTIGSSIYCRQIIASMADLLPLQTIWMVESLRGTTPQHLTGVVSPAIWGMLSRFMGIECISSIYYFLHYVLTPPEQYIERDDSIVAIEDTSTIITAFVAGYGMPLVAMTFLPQHVYRDRPWVVGALCELFPMWAVLFQRIFRRFVTTNPTIAKNEENRQSTGNREDTDLRLLRYAYIFSGTASIAMSLYLRRESGSSWLAAVFPPSRLGLINWSWEQALSSLVSAAGLFWQALHWKDLKGARKTKAPWWEIGRGMALTTLFGGPNVATMAGWTCREQALQRRAEKLE